MDTTAGVYTYDAEGRRIRRVVSGAVSDYVYDLAGHPMTEVNSTGTWVRGEVYVGSRHLATYSGGTSGTTYFNFSDWLGSERVRASVAAVSCETMTSLPFGDGQTTAGSCSGASPMHFTGKERDSESGLDYFVARHYSSPLGRLVQPDPDSATPLHLINPQRWNMYAYALNNPLTYTDPDGRDAAAVNFGLMVGTAGHQGILAIDGDGTVTYAEFGPASHGISNLGGAVASGSVNIDTNLPKLEFDSTHHPTEQSIAAVKHAIAQNDEGGIDPVTIRINYFQTSEADTMQLKSWMKERQQTPGRYRLIAVGGRQNCAVFCVRGLAAGKAITRKQASELSFVPNILYWELVSLGQQNEQKPLKEDVSHKICYTDENGKKVCQ